MKQGHLLKSYTQLSTPWDDGGLEADGRMLGLRTPVDAFGNECASC